MQEDEDVIIPPGLADSPRAEDGLQNQDTLDIKAGREAVRLALSETGLGSEEVEAEELKEAERIALRRMQKIMTYLTDSMTIKDTEKDPDIFAEEIFSNLEGGGIKPTTTQKAILNAAIKQYIQICNAIKPLREELESDMKEDQINGKIALLKKIGLDWANPREVEVDLDHPIFIGIRFSNKEDVNRARVNSMNRNPSGWIGAFKCNEIPELQSCIYFINMSRCLTEEEIKITKDHEIQHLIVYNFYPIDSHSVTALDYLGTFNVEEQRSMFDEALAYLKGGEYGESLKQLLGSEKEQKLETMRVIDKTIIKVKWEFLKKLYEIARRKKIKAIDLYEVLKTSHKLDDLLNLGLENLCSIQEQESWLKSWEKFLPPPVW